MKGKLVMDDINASGNPDYLEITANIDKSGPEPVVDVAVDLRKDVADLVIKVSLNAELAGEFREIYPVKDFNPCRDDVEDEFVKYALDLIEKFGNLTMACPMKAVIISCLVTAALSWIELCLSNLIVNRAKSSPNLLSFSP